MTTIDVYPLTLSKLKSGVELPPEVKVLEGKEVPENHNCFRIIHPDKGDERLVWRTDIMEHIREAKKVFLELCKKGLVPYKVDLNGEKTPEVMKEFDARAGEVIFMATSLAVGG